MSIKSLAGETAIYGLSSILGRLANFLLLTPFLTRVFSEAEYGLVNDLFFYTAFCIALLIFRLDTAVFRFASRSEHDPNQVFKVAQFGVAGFVVVFVCLGLGLAPWIADLLRYPDRQIYVQLVVLVVAFDALSAVPLARLRLQQRAWTFASINLFNIGLSIILVFFILYFAPLWELSWYDKQWMVAYYFGALLIASVLRYVLLVADGFWYAQKHPVQNHSESVTSRTSDTSVSEEDPDLRKSTSKTPLFPKVNLRMLIGYSAPLVIVALAGIVNSLVGPAMIKYWHGGTVTENLDWAGYYAAATKMAVFISLFVQAYNYAAEPFFFRHSGKDLAQSDKRIFADAARAFMLLGSLAAAAILLLLPWLQGFVAADKRVGFYLLPQLLAANILLGLYYNFAMAYKLTDRTYLGGIIALAGSTIVVGGNVLLVPRIGIDGSAWSILGCFTLMCTLAYLVTRRYFPVPYRLDKMLLYAVLSAAAVYAGNQFDAMLVRLAFLFGLTLVVALLEKGWLLKLVKN
ncbi:MAG: polysaccharide biosynthesis C-terminal domain-containing protein [Bacteroidota bacterium]